MGGIVPVGATPHSWEEQMADLRETLHTNDNVPVPLSAHEPVLQLLDETLRAKHVRCSVLHRVQSSERTLGMFGTNIRELLVAVRDNLDLGQFEVHFRIKCGHGPELFGTVGTTVLYDESNIELPRRQILQIIFT